MSSNEIDVNAVNARIKKSEGKKFQDSIMNQICENAEKSSKPIFQSTPTVEEKVDQPPCQP